MLEVYPDYYSDFKCLMGKCRHSCCIGWEIDIDTDTAEYYRSVGGHIGQRLNDCIDWGEQPYFKLSQEERCPFLNRDGLCDIILELGEDRLCNICADHPRFKNQLPDRVEIGLGLCCEAAARLILCRKEPMSLRYTDTPTSNDEIIALRDRVIKLLQDRGLTVSQRIDKMLDMCCAATIESDTQLWADRLLKLERLDESWGELLELLSDGISTDVLDRFDLHMAERQTEYEQLVVYLIYRHLANAPDIESVAARASFAALGYMLIRAIGAAVWSRQGSFDIEQQIELARLFSSEIEYSDENLYILLDQYL